MLVRDFMTRNPITIESTATLKRAMDEMERHDVRHLVVCDRNDPSHVIGIVSDRDLLSATGWVDEPGDTRRVGDVMSRSIQKTDPRAEVVEIAHALMLDSIGCLPVFEDDSLIGIVTESDLIGAFLKALEQGILPPGSDPKVSAKMTHDPLHAHPSDSVLEARILMRSRRIRHLPIVENGVLLGVLSDRDARRVEGRRQLREPVMTEMLRRRLVTIGPSQSLSTAAVLMLDRKISSLPVVFETKLLGILTTTDIIDHCAATLWQPPQFLRESAAG